MDDAAKRAKEVVPGMDIRLPGGRRLDDAIAAAIREAVDAEREQFPAELAANWEACGPWVPDADLVERGQAIKAQFVKMLADRRIREGALAKPAPDALLLLSAMTDEARLEVFGHFCTYCGSTNPNCQC